MTNEDELFLIDRLPIENITMGISDVAAISGVSPAQLRYWERKGYIQSDQTTMHHNRKYRYKTLIQVAVIKRYLDQGLTLAAAAKRASSRSALLALLKELFKDRVKDFTQDADGHWTLNLGPFDPDPQQTLLMVNDAGHWQARLQPRK